MELLKHLTVLKSSNGTVAPTPPNEEQDKKITYHNSGYGTAKACQGHAENLRSSLQALYHTYEKDCKDDIIQQQKLKQPFVTKLKGKNTALGNKTEKKDFLQKKIDALNESINKLKQDKIDVKRHPANYGIDVDKKSSAKFWIGLFLLVPLTLYIFIFYISTSYSGFFRNFDPSVDLFGGMFYPQALQEAYNDGLLELGFIVFIPFVFFGLGYLIHMFQEKKGILNYFKIAMLFAVTFVFDAILAYLIESKLYDLNKVYGAPEFSVSHALQSPGFWVIIFAGFVSYMIWGLVFDFIMKEHADRDKISLFINGLNTEIKDKENSRTMVKTELSEIDNAIHQLKVEISELEDTIDGFILAAKDYQNLSSQYLQGWQHCISAEIAMGPRQTEELLLRCSGVYNDHLERIGLSSFTGQNIIYKKTS